MLLSWSLFCLVAEKIEDIENEYPKRKNIHILSDRNLQADLVSQLDIKERS